MIGHDDGELTRTRIAVDLLAELQQRLDDLALTTMNSVHFRYPCPSYLTHSHSSHRCEPQIRQRGLQRQAHNFKLKTAYLQAFFGVQVHFHSFPLSTTTFTSLIPSFHPAAYHTISNRQHNLRQSTVTSYDISATSVLSTMARSRCFDYSPSSHRFGHPRRSSILSRVTSKHRRQG